MAKYVPETFQPGELKTLILGRTLKNELDYTPETWAEWTKVGDSTKVIFDSTGAQITTDATYFNGMRYNGPFKASTKYGILYNVVSSNLTQSFALSSSGAIAAGLPSSVGNQKVVTTSQADVTNKQNLYFYVEKTGPAGETIKIKDIRVFELPPGSEIEADFTNMTADQLAIKYPFYVNEQGKTGGVRSVGDIKATNIITNGDFRYGTIGWSAANSTISVNNGVLSNIGNGSSTYPYAVQSTSIPYALNKKIYIKPKVRVTNSSCIEIKVWVDATGMSTQVITVKSSPVQDVWYNSRGIVTLPSGGSGNVGIRILHMYPDAATANGKVMEVKEIMAIDLTATFGKGKEPDLATCDRIFADWFDGSKPLTRVRSVGKNLFNLKNVKLGLNIKDLNINGESFSFTSTAVNQTKSVGYNMYFGIGTYFVSGSFTASDGKSGGFAVYDPSTATFIVNYSSNGLNRSFTITKPGIYYFGVYQNYTSELDATITYSNVQLEYGSTATPYEPYIESTAIIPVELKQVGTVQDSFDVSTGVLTKRISDWVTLDGSWNWNFYKDNIGYKSLYLVNIHNGLYLTDSELVTKYNTAILKHTNEPATDYSSADLVRLSTLIPGLRITVADTDSGWPEDYTPTQNEIKAYFYGWKMCNSDGSSPWDGVSTKYWKKITDGTGITSTLPTASYAGFTPYKMIYQLANPIIKKYEPYIDMKCPNGLKAQKNGTLFIEKVDGGLVDIVPNLQLQYERSAS